MSNLGETLMEPAIFIGYARLKLGVSPMVLCRPHLHACAPPELTGLYMQIFISLLVVLSTSSDPAHV